MFATLMKRRLALAMGVLIVAVPAWGYWQALSRAVLHVSLNDVALKSERQAYGSVLAADVTFNDATGRVLANGSAVKPWGIVSMVHPEVGDCRREERAGGSAWHRCFDAQSRWLITWVPLVRTARVRLASCTIDRVPVAIEKSRDAWWLWWVPLPHIDNSPYTHFNVTMWIDGLLCRAVVADPLRADLS